MTDNLRLIKSTSIKWAWHVACSGYNTNGYRALVGNLGERDHFEDLGIDEDNITWTLNM
jgi:hypothetical protein